MTRDLEVYVDADGGVQFVYDDALAPLFAGDAATTRRASRVEPFPAGGWAADLAPVGGPLLGPFETRAAALDAEVEWLTRELARRRLEPAS